MHNIAIPWWLRRKASPCNAGDPSSIPGLGRSLGEGNGNPLQYSCLENSMKGGAWWAIVHGVMKSRTRLSDLFQYFSFWATSLSLLLLIFWCFDCGFVVPCRYWLYVFTPHVLWKSVLHVCLYLRSLSPLPHSCPPPLPASPILSFSARITWNYKFSFPCEFSFTL